MASIKATLKIETGSLLQVPVTFSVTATEQVNQGSDLVNLTIPAASDRQIYSGSTYNPSSVIYFYIKAEEANTSGVEVYLTNPAGVEILAMIVRPGDFAWFPLAAYSTGVQVRLNNLDEINPAKVTYLYGERG